MRYFIGNWKMFGVPKSIDILSKINSFYSKDKNRKKIEIFFNDTASPALIKDPSDFDSIFVIMPMKG